MLTLYYTVCEPVKYHIWYLVKWPFTISGMVKYQVTMGFLPTAAWYSDSSILPRSTSHCEPRHDQVSSTPPGLHPFLYTYLSKMKQGFSHGSQGTDASSHVEMI